MITKYVTKHLWRSRAAQQEFLSPRQASEVLVWSTIQLYPYMSMVVKTLMTTKQDKMTRYETSDLYTSANHLR